MKKELTLVEEKEVSVKSNLRKEINQSAGDAVSVVAYHFRCILTPLVNKMKNNKR